MLLRVSLRPNVRTYRAAWRSYSNRPPPEQHNATVQNARRGSHKYVVLQQYREFMRESDRLKDEDEVLGDYVRWHARNEFKKYKIKYTHGKRFKGKKRLNMEIKKGRRQLRALKAAQHDQSAKKNLISLAYGKTGRLSTLLKMRIKEAHRHKTTQYIKYPERYYYGLPASVKPFFNFCAEQSLGKAREGVASGPLTARERAEKDLAWFYDLDVAGYFLSGGNGHKAIEGNLPLYAEALGIPYGDASGVDYRAEFLKDQRCRRRETVLAMYRSFLRTSHSLHRKDAVVGEYLAWRAGYEFRNKAMCEDEDRLRSSMKKGKQLLRVVHRSSLGDDKAMVKMLRLAYGKTGRVMHLLMDRVGEAKARESLFVKKPEKYDGLPPSMKVYFDFCARQTLDRLKGDDDGNAKPGSTPIDHLDGPSLGMVVLTRPVSKVPKQSKRLAKKETQRGWYFDLYTKDFFVNNWTTSGYLEDKRLYAKALEFNLTSGESDIPVVSQAELDIIFRPLDP